MTLFRLRFVALLVLVFAALPVLAQEEAVAAPEPTAEEPIEGYEEPAAGGWGDYPLDEVSIRDERRTTADVLRRIEQGRFHLDPDFQQDFVWDAKKQSRLIESILMRIPLPVFYVAEDAAGRLIVVDGRQRLTTLQRFRAGELELNLGDRPELHGKKYKDLEVRLQNRVDDCQLLFYIIDHKVPERARLDIFERVNGGEVLTRQQMRNAIYSGPGTQFLKGEASSELFLAATGRSLSTKKMQDREFVNRFCSFTLLPLETYKGDMDAWLAQGLVALGKMSEPERQDLANGLRLGLRNNLAVFGKHAFRKHRTPDQTRSLINASLFDIMMAELSVRSEEIVAERADELRQAFYRRMEDPRFIKSITYGPNTPKTVRTRF
ncbi:MAG: DUF262 domain-containing protein, partial [Nitrospiraceae bacterium]|nr:DUF262 domain-containing protein [Nitrospiraceae bacterium]